MGGDMGIANISMIIDGWWLIFIVEIIKDFSSLVLFETANVWTNGGFAEFHTGDILELESRNKDFWGGTIVQA